MQSIDHYHRQDLQKSGSFSVERLLATSDNFAKNIGRGDKLQSQMSRSYARHGSMAARADTPEYNLVRTLQATSTSQNKNKLKNQ